MISRVIRYLTLSFLAVVTLLIMCLPQLPSAIAGYLTLVSFCAIPLFFITLLTLFLMWKHKKERYVLLCLLVLSLTYLHPYIPRISSHLSSLEEKQVPGTLTVVSWNADNFQLCEDTLRAAVQTITHLHPDMICLQERPHTSLLNIEKVKSAFHDYPYMVTNSREDEILNVTVFSRYPLTSPQAHYFTHTFNKYLSVDVLLPQKVSAKVPRLRIYDIHLQTTGLSDHGDSSSGSFLQRILLPFRANSIVRNGQADYIAADIARSPYPVIVCGDFNDIRTSYAYRTVANRLEDTYGGWATSYTYHIASLSQRLAKITHCNTVPVKIDHILVSTPLKPSFYKQPTFTSGDHRIQCAVIRLPQ